MEVIRYPHNTCTSFISWKSAGLGLFTDSNEILWENIPTCTMDPWMAEGKGYHGENRVTHVKADSEFSYSPLHQLAVPNPTINNPKQIVIPATFVGRVGNRTMTRGVVSGSSYAPFLPTGKWSGVQHFAFVPNNFGYWTMYCLAASITPGFASASYKYEIIAMANINNDEVYVTSTYRGGSSGFYVGQSITQELDCSTVVRICDAAGFPGTPTTEKARCSRYRISTEKWLQFYQVQEMCRQYRLVSDFGDRVLPSKHFGELAGDAGATMNANDVNMFEFLKDLRHPTKMIPKLRNLKALRKFWASSGSQQAKALSDDYLAAKYGILPTISDLQNIVRAVKKRKPSKDLLDRTLLTKSHHASLRVDDISFTLEQHVKLCVDTNANTLDSIIRDVENVGFSPTLSNMWDLVPFSFVVDWFVNVGDLLDQADKAFRLFRFRIYYSTLSIKRCAQGSITATPDLPFHGQIRWSYYHRWVQIGAPLPPLSLPISSNGASHWLEATALIIQRKNTR